MRSQDAPGDTPRFEQAVAQQHRVADGPPYRPYGVAPGGDTLNEYRVDPHAYRNRGQVDNCARGAESAAYIGVYGNFCFITVAGVREKRHKSD